MTCGSSKDNCHMFIVRVQQRSTHDVSLKTDALQMIAQLLSCHSVVPHSTFFAYDGQQCYVISAKANTRHPVPDSTPLCRSFFSWCLAQTDLSLCCYLRYYEMDSICFVNRIRQLLFQTNDRNIPNPSDYSQLQFFTSHYVFQSFKSIDCTIQTETIRIQNKRSIHH